MIDIQNIEAFIIAMKTEVEQITAQRLVVADIDFAKHVNDLEFYGGVGVVAVIPSSNPHSKDVDCIEFKENLNIYLVKKWQHNDGYTAFVDIFKVTQPVVKKVINLLAVSIQERNCNYPQLNNINWKSISVDPVSEYHGTVGYVLSFDIINTYTK